MRVLSCRVWRDHSFAAPLCEPIAQPSCVVSPIRQQASGRWDARQQLGDTGQIVRLARRQTQRNGSSDLIGQGMNLGRPSAARAPDGLSKLPPFPPEAERWALTDVLSALVVPITPEDPERT